MDLKSWDSLSTGHLEVHLYLQEGRKARARCCSVKTPPKVLHCCSLPLPRAADRNQGLAQSRIPGLCAVPGHAEKMRLVSSVTDMSGGKPCGLRDSWDLF